MVNLCFSIELFLKALIIARKDVPPKTHSLRELFDFVGEDVISNIKNEFEKKVQDPDFDSFVETISSYFLKVRYEYENEVFEFNEHFIHVLARCVYIFTADSLGVKSGIDKLRP